MGSVAALGRVESNDSADASTRSSRREFIRALGLLRPVLPADLSRCDRAARFAALTDRIDVVMLLLGEAVPC
jgi:hypothetical protein